MASGYCSECEAIIKIDFRVGEQSPVKLKTPWGYCDRPRARTFLAIHYMANGQLCNGSGKEL